MYGNCERESWSAIRYVVDLSVREIVRGFLDDGWFGWGALLVWVSEGGVVVVALVVVVVEAGVDEDEDVAVDVDVEIIYLYVEGIEA